MENVVFPRFSTESIKHVRALRSDILLAWKDVPDEARDLHVRHRELLRR